MKDNTILWIIGITILLVVLNNFNIIDFSQFFAIKESVSSASPIGVGEIKHYIP